MNDKLREEFEAWRIGEGHRIGGRSSVGDGYVYEDDDLAWDTWKAARTTLVIELPEERSTAGKHFENWSHAADYNDGIEACREALTKAGVTVK